MPAARAQTAQPPASLIAIHRVDHAGPRQHVLGLAALQMADHVPRPAATADGRDADAATACGLRRGFLHPVLAEDAQPGRLRRGDHHPAGCVLLTATSVDLSRDHGRRACAAARCALGLSRNAFGKRGRSQAQMLRSSKDESQYQSVSAFAVRLRGPSSLSQHHHRAEMPRLPLFGPIRVELVHPAGGAEPGDLDLADAGIGQPAPVGGPQIEMAAARCRPRRQQIVRRRSKAACTASTTSSPTS